MDKTGRDGQAAGLEADLSAPVVKRSVRVAGHPTSITLEEPFWQSLKCCAKKQGVSVNKLATMIDEMRSAHVNLSSAIRLYVLHNQKQCD